MRPYSCTQDWRGRSVVIVGNGPSLKGVDLSRLEGFVVITTNSSYLLYPHSDVQMCSDRHWLAANGGFPDEYKGKQIIITQPQAVVREDPRMCLMRTVKIWKTSKPFNDPGTLAEGHTSISTSISLATLRGAKLVFLIGVDLKPGPGGVRRSTGTELDAPNAKARYRMMADHLTIQSRFVRRAGVTVFDCNPYSQLRCYPKKSLEECLSWRIR